MAEETAANIFFRRIARNNSESRYVNTLNVAWRVTLDFVWHPGATLLAPSRVDPLIGHDPGSGNRRDIWYTWQRDGGPRVRRVMNSGRITINLPPGKKGVLTVFRTEWELRRPATGTRMSAVNTMTGVQQRLNRLGYHLRAPGRTTPGVDGGWGRRTEIATLQFQVDYSPPARVPAAAGNKLPVRGEWIANTDANYLANLRTYNGGTVVANPSGTDGTNFRASLRARVGS